MEAWTTRLTLNSREHGDSFQHCPLMGVVQEHWLYDLKQELKSGQLVELACVAQGLLLAY